MVYKYRDVFFFGCGMGVMNFFVYGNSGDASLLMKTINLVIITLFVGGLFIGIYYLYSKIFKPGKSKKEIQKEKLLSQARSALSENKKFTDTCPYCEKTNTLEINDEDIEKLGNGAEISFACDYCKKSFTSDKSILIDVKKDEEERGENTVKTSKSE